MMTALPSNRPIDRLRTELAYRKLDGFVLPHHDEHQNEFLPPANERLAWLTGFTGSQGMALVLSDRAILFVDARYREQAADEIDTRIYEIDRFENNGLLQFLGSANLTALRIGFDPRLHNRDTASELSRAVGQAGGELVAVASNVLDVAWEAERPAAPSSKVVPHEAVYAGEGSSSKRMRIGRSIAECGADATLLTSPASVAWLFNIRGRDVPRTPIAMAQAIVLKDGSAQLFLDHHRCSYDLVAHLGPDVAIRSPDDLPAALRQLAGANVLLDMALASSWHVETLQSLGAILVESRDPCALPRACKNAIELEGAKTAHLYDGVALTNFLFWLAGRSGSGTPPDEVEAAAQLDAFRRASPHLVDLSFDTILGVGPHSAMAHYRPSAKTNIAAPIGSLILIDSGGQYLSGTTDVTRTVAIGEPCQEMKQCFTRVLQGHLALARLKFPVGTTGSQIDVLARVPLWEAGLDYGHGTGHGVGSYLSVHEGPQSISKVPNAVALEPGMIVSNEPGYYRPGAFGIRIENLQYVTLGSAAEHGGPMLMFETLTLAPIDRRLIAVEMLSDRERNQLDEYHARVNASIAPHLEGDARDWLATQTLPL